MTLPRILPITEGNKTSVMEEIDKWVVANFHRNQQIKWRKERYWFLNHTVNVIVLRTTKGEEFRTGYMEFYQHVDVDIKEIDWIGLGMPIYAEHWLVAGCNFHPERSNLQHLCWLWGNTKILTVKEPKNDREKELKEMLHEAQTIINQLMPYNPPYCHEMLEQELAKYDTSLEVLIDSFLGDVSR